MSGDGSAWRLIVDPAADAAWNMAVDEAVLETYDQVPEPIPPTLRLYGWQPAALSLGRTPHRGKTHDESALRSGGIDLVRRPTGGDVVLHEFERTYAVIGGLHGAPFGGSVVATYRLISNALAVGLARLGVAAVPLDPPRGGARRDSAACFERGGTYELAVGKRKLVGSAQARRRRAFLQHGSIPIRLSASRLGEMVGRAVDGSRFVDLESAAGRAIDAADLDRAIISGFESHLDVSFVRGSLTTRESLRAAELRCWKYDSMTWTLEGRIGVRERRWGPTIV